MNLDDLTLLRGWIRHVKWVDLDTQRQEGGESARKRIKTLLRKLAVKSRFYGKPAWLKLWSSERLSTVAWERRALNALTALNSLPQPSPALDHAVEQWFPEAVCNNLPFSAKTLTDVAEPLESFYAGESALPDDLNPSLRLLVNFFDEHALSLGYQLNKKPRSTVLPVPLDKVVPLDRVLYRLSSMANKGVTVRQSPAGYRPLTTGLRIHELAAASYGDIECLEDESGEHYFLQVIGKQNKMRKTSLPLMFVR